MLNQKICVKKCICSHWSTVLFQNRKKRVGCIIYKPKNLAHLIFCLFPSLQQKILLFFMSHEKPVCHEGNAGNRLKNNKYNFFLEIT